MARRKKRRMDVCPECRSEDVYSEDASRSETLNDRTVRFSYQVYTCISCGATWETLGVLVD